MKTLNLNLSIQELPLGSSDHQLASYACWSLARALREVYGHQVNVVAINKRKQFTCAQIADLNGKGAA